MLGNCGFRCLYFVNDAATQAMNANNAVLNKEIEIVEKILDCLSMLSLKRGVLFVHNMLKLFLKNGDAFLLLVKKFH